MRDTQPIEPIYQPGRFSFYYSSDDLGRQFGRFYDQIVALVIDFGFGNLQGQVTRNLRVLEQLIDQEMLNEFLAESGVEKMLVHR